MLRFPTLIIACLLYIATCPAQPSGKVYSGHFLQSLRTPIGGIGTGNILLGGRGNIEHLEIFNRPDRRRRLEKTGFAIWYKQGRRPAVAKLLEREIFPPYQESTHKYVAGLPRFRRAEFINDFPLQHWRFRDEDIPIRISLEAFSPFIPLDVAQSSYPLAAFYWDLENITADTVEASIVLNLENPIVGPAITNEYYTDGPLQGIRFQNRDSSQVNYRGGLFMGTTAPDVQVQTHWYPGRWRDETHIFWDDFSADGAIEPDTSDWAAAYQPTAYNESTGRMASILVRFSLPPGQQLRIPFYLAWYFPERVFRASEVFGIAEAAEQEFQNAYARQFGGELDVLKSFLAKEAELHDLSARFAGILQVSTYPESVKEALTTQAASIRTNLIQVTGRGNVHGFEGVLQEGWCCPGTCTHVWNYEQALASLFPSLERKMREIEFLHNTFDNGFQTHRSVLPIGDYWFDGPAAADGQMGTIVRAYREWKLSGDNAWLARLWPRIQKALEFAWYGPGEVQDERFKFQEQQMAWDPGRTGMLSGRQHNTYDINFFGPSSMTTSIYLAALKAGAEMAEAMQEPDKAKTYREVYESGVRLMQDSLWNGDYFIQIIADDPSAAVQNEYEPQPQNGGKIPKYQYGDGCLSDQLLGQYLAFISGLGYILDSTRVKRALKSVYDHNFIRPLRQFANVQRVYGLNDESGVVLCTWPKGNRPALPFVYSDEIWTGVEYQVAASLIYSGLVREGLEIVQAVQDRYDGFKRNPFEHDESGVHYARAMASWSLLPALSGIEYDAVTKSLSFDPKISASDFSTFWSTGKAWGSFSIQGKAAQLSVDFGELELKHLALKGKRSVNYDQPLRLEAGDVVNMGFE